MLAIVSCENDKGKGKEEKKEDKPSHRVWMRSRMVGANMRKAIAEVSGEKKEEEGEKEQ